MSPTWFRKDIDPGTIITLDQPETSKWKVVKRLNEYDHQLDEDRHRLGFHLSFACTKLLCCDPEDDTKLAFMRIYLQVPFRGTEMDDARTRASQAIKRTPQELIAYQDLTQKSSNTPKLLGHKTTVQGKSGLVPGGFAVWLVWEMVLGLRLGNKNGPDAFWTLGDSEREEIRVSFMKTFAEMREVGYLPDKTALSSLVWHKDSNTLYFIGFRDCNFGQPKGPVVAAKWVAHYGLAIPNSNEWLKKGWNQDTSAWKW
ncbi:hypothetical protein N7527_011455 [Penicillium freii]|uniref:Uncharacterized protein n=1 Tax=Penicillium freii TaxID=48697 RepID=A0A101M7R0_PENFR|nr:hypothetical protein N7527_011455 [Penicillium freii]KUM55495.1 hypothetical protein ACN42_g11770 [Penicillium freii]